MTETTSPGRSVKGRPGVDGLPEANEAAQRAAAPRRPWAWLFSSGAEQLPPRLREVLQAQENSTERIISWIQLAVVLTFGALYLVSPKPYLQELEFTPVPWVLAVYLVLTLIRVVWSHMRRLPDWSLALSVFFDMALLMGLIWSFHIQYMQPASFYLKSPTLLYVFIFIALRALRFDPRFVLLAGVVASLMWGLMVLYVIYADPSDSMITRDYVAYMTSNSVLIGAEFDKIISILVVSLIIAIALLRGRRLLVRAVAEQAAAQELSRFFAPEVAARIKVADQTITAGSGELRPAAVMNLDLRGFTPISQRIAPDEVMALLSDYQRRLVPVIRAHGGSVDKFLGDGIMATFGAVRPSGSYAADALRALDAVMDEAARWRRARRDKGEVAPEVNGAVASGPVVFGAVGDQDRLEYTVIGDAVNLAAKLEKHNKAAGVRALCDRTTYDLAVRQGYRPPSARHPLSGSRIAGVAGTLELVVLAD